MISIFAFRKDLFGFFGDFIREKKLTGELNKNFSFTMVETADFYWAYIDQDSDFIKAFLKDYPNQEKINSSKNGSNKNNIQNLQNYNLIGNQTMPLDKKYKEVIIKALLRSNVIFITDDEEEENKK